MKILLPIFKDLPIDAGCGMRLKGLNSVASEKKAILFKLWSGFDIVAQKEIPLVNLAHQFLLKDYFSTDEINNAGMATVEFANFPSSEAQEIQLVFVSRNGQNWSSVLYDMIPDKKAGHKYAPILHSAHAGFVGPESDCYVLLVNFRPPFLKADHDKQKMFVKAKTKDGAVVSDRIIEFGFNETTVLSFSDEFRKSGGFEPGSQLNTKGGESQFAIFTLFFNKKTQAMGIEHSLAPMYYCSTVYDPKFRNLFYKNALKDTESKPL